MASVELTRRVNMLLDGPPDEIESSIGAIIQGADPGAWVQIVIPRLRQRLTEELEASPRGSRPNVESGRLGEILERWNLLGINVAVVVGMSEAEGLFRALLSVLRAAQERLGRLHKGTPLHELGWLRLRTDPPAARPYIFAALIEDCIRDPNGFRAGPAARVCRDVLGRGDAFFDEVEEFVAKDVPGSDEMTALARSDPELLSLVHSTHDEPGGELLQISLHFDPALAEILRTAGE
jgi:hypothetical protein